MVILYGNTSQNNYEQIRRFGNLRLPSSVKKLYCVSFMNVHMENCKNHLGTIDFGLMVTHVAVNFDLHLGGQFDYSSDSHCHVAINFDLHSEQFHTIANTDRAKSAKLHCHTTTAVLPISR